MVNRKLVYFIVYDLISSSLVSTLSNDWVSETVDHQMGIEEIYCRGQGRGLRHERCISTREYILHILNLISILVLSCLNLNHVLLHCMAVLISGVQCI